MEGLHKEKLDKLLDLYCELDRWARSHDIVIFLDWGSLLGAVRHRGFIPWDFDLDVSVTWGNYQKLLKAWDVDPIPNRELVDIFRYPNYPSLFLRYVDKTTTEIRRASAWDLAPTGMSIDIFPLIPVPKEEQAKRRVMDSFLVYYELSNPMMLNKRTRKDSMRSLMSIEKENAKRDRIETLNKLERIIFTTTEEDCEEYIEMEAGLRDAHLIQKKSLGNYTELPFEGYMAYVPEHYVEVLNDEYGVTWRQCPKATSGYHYVQNLNIPYDIYVSDYMQFLDKETVIADHRHFKELEIEEMLLRNEMSPMFHEIRLKERLISVERFGKPSRYRFGLTKELRDSLDQYVEMQLSKDYRYWKIWGGLSDAWLKLICDEYLEEGKYDLAMRLISLRIESNPHPIEIDLRRTKEQIELVFAVYNAIDYGDTQKVSNTLKLFNHRDTLVGAHAQLFIEQARTKENGEWEAFLESSNAFYSSYPFDYEIQRYLAYALGKTGQKDEASLIYKRIENSCRNGMTLLRATDDIKELEIG